jgi:hypothetical protein
LQQLTQQSVVLIQWEVYNHLFSFSYFYSFYLLLPNRNK